MNTLSQAFDIAQNAGQMSHGMHILLVYTLMALAPAMLVLCTSFTRILVVLGFLRQAMGSPTIPPNMVLIPLAMLLTLLSMGPVLDEVYVKAVQPALDGQVTPLAAYQEAAKPLRAFMLRNTKERDLLVLGKAAKMGTFKTLDDVPLRLIIPAFALSELRTAFRMGFTLFMTFLTVDLVVAGVLSALGLMMVPPMSVSLPLKLLLFVIVDGWTLICGSLIASVH